jgi:cytochrome c biogenesis protein CcmG/thiol:disulfide interchange protein DsbE
MLRYIVPLVVFLAVAGFLLRGLDLNPHEVPSPFIDKPAPAFNLQKLSDPQSRMSDKDLLGQVWLLNVWASWCVACRTEAPLMDQFAQAKIVPIYGLNYKDVPSDAKAWLRQFGNPYVANLIDYEGNIGIDYGVYGVPETFVIDKQGVIRHKVIGPITPSILDKCVVPLVRKLQQATDQQVVTRDSVEGCV